MLSEQLIIYNGIKASGLGLVTMTHVTIMMGLIQLDTGPKP